MLPSLRPGSPNWTNRRLSQTKRLLDLQRLSSAAPEDVALLRDLAQMQYSLGDYEAAEKNLEAAKALQKDDASTLVELSRARFALWALRRSQALGSDPWLEKAAQASRDALACPGVRVGPEHLLESAQVILLEGDARTATELLTQLVSHYPRWPRLNEAAFLCGIVCYRFGQFDNAVGYLQYALIRPPPGLTEIDVAPRLGRAFERARKAGLGQVALEKCFLERIVNVEEQDFERWQADPSTWEQLSDRFLAERDVIFAADAAEQALKRLNARLKAAKTAKEQIKTREQCVPMFLRLAECNDKLRDFEEAAALVAQAYAFGPFDYRVRAHRVEHFPDQCEHFPAQEAAATQIQQWIRRFNAKCHLISLQNYRARLKNRLSQQLAIQWKGHVARQVLARRRLEHESAIILQRLCVAFLPQKEAVILRIKRHRGARHVQRIRRGMLAREDLRMRHKRATAIQGRLRGMQTRSLVDRMHAACTVLTAAVRGHQVRRLLRRRFMGSDERRTFATPEFDGEEAVIMSCWHVTREGKGWLPFACCSDADAVAELSMLHNRALIFNSPSLSGWDVHRLCRLVRMTASPELHTLMLYGPQIGDTAVQDLCRTLSALPGLTSLGLGTCNVSLASVAVLADVLEAEDTAFRLKKLFLEHSPCIGDLQVVRIIRAVQRHGVLERLQLSGLGLTNRTVNQCAEMAARNPQLHTLGLDYNRIGDDGVRALSEALCSSPSLTTLRLANNPSISDEGAEALAVALRHPRCALRELDLCGTRVADRGALALASALEENETLSSLFVADCMVGRDGFAALKKVRGKNDIFVNLAVNFKSSRERVMAWIPF